MDPPPDEPPTDVTVTALEPTPCPECTTAVIAGARFCSSCGAVHDSAADDSAGDTPSSPPPTTEAGVATKVRTCPTCDLVADETTAYCPRCGTHLGSGGAPPEGWRADPFGTHAFRWWDGTRWTAYAYDHDVVWDPVSFDDPPPPGVRGVGIAWIGFVAGVLLSLGTTAALRALDEPGGRAVLLVASSCALWIGLGGAILGITITRGTRSLTTDYGLRFRWIDIPLGIAGWLGGRILGALLVIPIVALWPNLDFDQGEGIYGNHTPSVIQWVALIAVVCVGAPFIEELFFRGLVQTRLVGRYGSVTGILITAVLFGAAHLIGWVGPITIVFVVAIVGAGIVFGILRVLTGRLGPSIVAHMVFNVQAILVFALMR